MLYRDWAKQWLAERRGSSAPRTIEQYQDIMTRYILPMIGETSLDELTPMQISAAVNYVMPRMRTAQLIHTLIGATMREAYRLGLTDNRAIDRTIKPRHQPAITGWWSAAQMRRYIVAGRESPHLLAWLLAGLCGLRRGELAGLRWDDITGETIHVRRQRQRTAAGVIERPLKTRAGYRTIPVSDVVAYYLETEHEKHPLSDHVIVDHRGRAIDPQWLTRWWRADQRAAGIPEAEQITLHGLRHTMASIAIEAGASVRELQPALGHANYETTANIYAHVTARQAARAVLAVSKAVITPDS